MELKSIVKRIKGKKPDKSQFFILALVGILLLVIALPTGNKNVGENTETSTEQEEEQLSIIEEQDEVEERLEKILEQIEGVGEVQVMITYKDSGTQVVEKDLNSSSSNSTEVDSTGGERDSTDMQHQETTIYTGEENEPFVSQELEPEIEGVLVVAQGGGSSIVKENISEAVLALFPIEAHKIKVVKMNWKEDGE